MINSTGKIIPRPKLILILVLLTSPKVEKKIFTNKNIVINNDIRTILFCLALFLKKKILTKLSPKDKTNKMVLTIDSNN